MSQGRVTMQQIADACGVSKVTVSLALKGHTWRMSEATYKKVLKTAKKMGYTQDAQLSKLATYLVDQRRGKSIQGELAYLMILRKDAPEYARNMYFYKIMKPIAHDYGYRLEVYEHEESGELGMTAKQLERIWDTRGVRGIFVAPSWLDKAPPFNWEKYSWIAFGESLKKPSLHRIDSDFRLATIECFTQLHRLGYKRIGLMVTMGYDRAMQFSIRSAYDAFHVMHPEATRLRLMDEDLPPVFDVKAKAFKKWIEEEKPDAIISELKILENLTQMGYKVPKDFAFATWHLEGGNPHNFSGVTRAEDTLAKTSVELMLSQIEHGVHGVPAAPIRTRITGHWQNGKTTRSRKMN